MLTRLLACIRKESLALGRDVHALIALFVMPAAFILILSLALQDWYHPSQGSRYEYVLLDHDGGAQAQAFASAYAAASRDRPIAGDLGALDSARAQYAIEIAPDFGARLLAGSDRPLVSVIGAPDLPAAALALLQARAADRLARQRLQSLPGIGGELTIEQRMGDGLVTSRYVEQANSSPTAVQQNVPAWLIFGMFFVVLPLSTILIAERAQGTLQRLRSMQVSPLLFFAGKLVPFFALNLLQGAVMLAVGVFLAPLFGADALQIGNSYVALGAVLAAVSCAALGYSLLVATLARTSEQANIIGGLGNVLLGAIGGIMVPKMVMAPGMRAWTDISPMAWGHEAMLRLFLRGGGIAQVLPQIGALAAFGFACTALAWYLIARRLAR